MVWDIIVRFFVILHRLWSNSIFVICYFCEMIDFHKDSTSEMFDINLW